MLRSMPYCTDLWHSPRPGAHTFQSSAAELLGHIDTALRTRHSEPPLQAFCASSHKIPHVVYEL
eukprot:7193217-Karenia_brevis.AAC.1